MSSVENESIVDIGSDSFKFEMSVSKESDGIHIKAKCKQIEDFFRPREPMGYTWHGIDGYNYPSLPVEFSDCISTWDNDVLFIDDRYKTRPNLGWLRMVGLSEGIDLHLVNHVCINDDLDKFILSCEKMIPQFYKVCIKPHYRKLEIVINAS